MNEINLNKIIATIPDLIVPKTQPIYTWWGWHPRYPKWAKSCWCGSSIEEAHKSLASYEQTYYLALVGPDDEVVEYKKPINLGPWQDMKVPDDEI